MDSGSLIDDIVESGIVRLLDWNDSMTDIQLGMGFVDKVQTISAVFANDPEIPVSNIIQEVQVFCIGFKPEDCIQIFASQNKQSPCEKWQTYTLTCSHVLTVCRENRTYQANFHPILSDNFWRDVPFNLTFYPPNMKKERAALQALTDATKALTSSKRQWLRRGDARREKSCRGKERKRRGREEKEEKTTFARDGRLRVAMAG
ncbi:hypothetical protein M9H77_32143 [Catharanthus roseus]|uniref:Uncharacterized protein n=1 Tax=Catharanthus roseus TaxID=4058 RepID=A0ACC0A2H1_CATRO|nr:hypothetical protein M9H77_32143 [Catharanthus roseus]